MFVCVQKYWLKKLFSISKAVGWKNNLLFYTLPKVKSVGWHCPRGPTLFSNSLPAKKVCPWNPHFSVNIAWHVFCFFLGVWIFWFKKFFFKVPWLRLPLFLLDNGNFLFSHDFNFLPNKTFIVEPFLRSFFSSETWPWFATSKKACFFLLVGRC